MINSRKRFKIFNKAINYFITLGFEIKSVYLYDTVIDLTVCKYKNEIRIRYKLRIYDFMFVIYYLRTHSKHLYWKQKEISKNYKIN